MRSWIISLTLIALAFTGRASAQAGQRVLIVVTGDVEAAPRLRRQVARTANQAVRSLRARGRDYRGECAERDCAMAMRGADADVVLLLRVFVREESISEVLAAAFRADGEGRGRGEVTGDTDAAGAVRQAVSRALTGDPVRPDQAVHTVTLRGSPEGASVTIDGTPHGALPHVVQLQAGSHRIAIARPGFRDEVREVQIDGDQTLTFDLVAAEDDSQATGGATTNRQHIEPPDDGTDAAATQEPPRSPRPWLLASGIGLLAAGVAGVVASSFGLATSGDCVDDGCASTRGLVDVYDPGARTWAFLSLGIAAIIGGGALVIVGTRIEPTVSPRGGGLRLTTSF